MRGSPESHSMAARPLRKTGQIPSLNGIRAVAVSLVVFAHSGLEDIVPGGLGVTIFFVLSGYLITTLMRIEFATTGTLAFKAFYMRRLLRLMPPLLLVIIIAAALSYTGIIDGHYSPEGLLSLLFYFGNYYVIAHDFHGIPAGLGVIWSLAVEEHYYLVFPALALLLLRFGHRQLSVLLLSLACLAVLAWRYALMLHGVSEAYIGMATDTRVDAILVGCTMALGMNPWLDAVPQKNTYRDAAITILCVMALLATLLYRDPLFRTTLRYSVQSIAIAPLIYLSVARADQWPFRWLNLRPVARLGVLSYSVYLSHQVILFGIEAHWPDLGWLPTTAATVILTLAFAEAMNRYVERPFARLRRRLHRERSSSRCSNQPVRVPS